MKTKVDAETLSTKTFVLADGSEAKLTVVRRKTVWVFGLAYNKKKMTLRADKTLSHESQTDLIGRIRVFIDTNKRCANQPRRANLDITYSMFSWFLQVAGRHVFNELSNGVITARHPYVLVSYDNNEGRVKVGLYLKNKFQGFVGSKELKEWLLTHSNAVIYPSVGCEIIEKSMIARERLINNQRGLFFSQNRVISALAVKSYYWYVLLEHQTRIFEKEFWEREGVITMYLNYASFIKDSSKLTAHSDPKKRLFTSNLYRETSIRTSDGALDIKIYRSANSWVVTLGFLEQKNRFELALTMINESQKLFGGALIDWLLTLTRYAHSVARVVFDWVEGSVSEFLLKALQVGEIVADHPYIRCDTARCDRHNRNNVAVWAYKGDTKIKALSSNDTLQFLLDNPSTVIYSNKTTQLIEHRDLFLDVLTTRELHLSVADRAGQGLLIRAQYWADFIWLQKNNTGRELWCKMGGLHSECMNEASEDGYW